MGTFVTDPDADGTAIFPDGDKASSPRARMPTGWTNDNVWRASEMNAVRDALLDLRTDARADIFNVRHYPTPAAAVAAAVANGKGKVYFPAGEHSLEEPIACATSGVHFVGDGPGSTTVKAAAGFTGSALFILGDKVSTNVTVNVCLGGMTLDCNGLGVSGLEIYGLRDGSRLEDVYVTKMVNVPGVITNMAGNGSGVATLAMCQGMQIRNCHVISTQNHQLQASEAWRLDGIYESQFVGCTFRGTSTTDNSGSAGFRIGSVSETRGVVLLGCTSVYLKGAGDPCYGIHYGEWARDCWDEFTSFEQIIGSAVYFHGSEDAGTLLPFNCKTLSPRLYKLPDVGLLDPAFRFGDASACFVGPVVHYHTGKTWVRFDAPVAAQQFNVAEVQGDVDPADLTTTAIDFDASSAASNLVRGVSSSGAARRTFALTRDGQGYVHEANGTFWEHVAAQSRLKLNGNSFLLEDENSVDRVLVGSTQTALAPPALGTVELRNSAGTALLRAVDTALGGYLQAVRAHLFDSYLEIQEIATPSAAPSDKARLYAKDNGSGKTQLVVIFPSGAEQVLATEP